MYATFALTQLLPPYCHTLDIAMHIYMKCHPATGRTSESPVIKPFILPRLHESLNLSMNLYYGEFIHHKDSTQYSSLSLASEVSFNCEPKVHKTNMNHNTVILLITITIKTSNQIAMSDD